MQNRLSSWQAVQAEIGSIAARINADPALAIAAALNPLHAFEALGYEIGPEVRSELEDRIRFGRKRARRLSELRQQINHYAGCSLDPDSDQEVATFLSEKLKGLPHGAESAAPTHGSRTVAAHGDALADITGAHPVIEPVLEYRRIQASAPRLADRATFDAVRAGHVRTPLRRVVFRLKNRGNS